MGKIITIEELKSLQLDIMDDIHQFCVENDLRYCLAYGSLLGAIRHGGYIPWDDDIDIMMPRADYERFIELYNRNQSPYRMVSFENSPSYALPFGKVHDSRTKINENLYKGVGTYGIYIDVFPIDGFSNMSIKNKAYYLRRIINIKLASSSGRSFLKYSLMCVVKLLLLPFGIPFVLRRLKKLSTVCDYDSSSRVAYIASMDKGESSIFNRSSFDELILHKFEDREYLIPKGYEDILTNIYGNYMTLPPEEKRISNHSLDVSWVD